LPPSAPSESDALSDDESAANVIGDDSSSGLGLTVVILIAAVGIMAVLLALLALPRLLRTLRQCSGRATDAPRKEGKGSGAMGGRVSNLQVEPPMTISATPLTDLGREMLSAHSRPNADDATGRQVEEASPVARQPPSRSPSPGVAWQPPSRSPSRAPSRSPSFGRGVEVDVGMPRVAGALWLLAAEIDVAADELDAGHDEDEDEGGSFGGDSSIRPSEAGMEESLQLDVDSDDGLDDAWSTVTPLRV